MGAHKSWPHSNGLMRIGRELRDTVLGLGWGLDAIRSGDFQQQMRRMLNRDRSGSAEGIATSVPEFLPPGLRAVRCWCAPGDRLHDPIDLSAYDLCPVSKFTYNTTRSECFGLPIARTQVRWCCVWAGTRSRKFSLAEKMRGAPWLCRSPLMHADVVLVAIPRGGVPVAVEISAHLSLPVHVLVVERIQAPMHDAWQQRLSIGAIAPGGVEVLDNERIAEFGISPEDARLAVECSRHAHRTTEAFYATAPPLASLQGRTVILVDDAIETAATIRAAIKSLRKMEASQIVIAVPAISEPVYQQISGLTSLVFCLKKPPAGGAPHACFSHLPARARSQSRTIGTGPRKERAWLKSR